MGRKKNLHKEELLQTLGAGKGKNWTYKELLEMEVRANEKKAKAVEQEALTTIIAGKAPEVPAAELEIPYDLRQREEKDPFGGLTERQKNIARLRLRGLSQQSIGNIVGIPQPVVSQELKKIKDWQAERGANVEQAAVVGHISSVYEEVQQAAWLLYSQAKNDAESPTSRADQAKALAVVQSAAKEHGKFLMDLGLIRKAAQEVKHVIEPSQFMKEWKDGSAKKNLADHMVTSQLKALPEPTLDDVVDAEIEEETTNEVVIVKASDLAEPTEDVLEIDDK